MRVYNFSAGPSTLPLEVLETAKSEFLDFNNTGMSITEMSHRSKPFMAVNDEANALLRKLLNIPEDYSVMGFDGLDITYYYNPSITTIRQPVEDMAVETLNILFDLIENKSANQHKLFQGELMIRQSIAKLNK